MTATALLPVKQAADEAVEMLNMLRLQVEILARHSRTPDLEAWVSAAETASDMWLAANALRDMLADLMADPPKRAPEWVVALEEDGA
jgi:hypothetical protein